MATPGYLEALHKKSKAYLPDWMMSQLFRASRASAGGKAKAAKCKKAQPAGSDVHVNQPLGKKRNKIVKATKADRIVDDDAFADVLALQQRIEGTDYEFANGNIDPMVASITAKARLDVDADHYGKILRGDAAFSGEQDQVRQAQSEPSLMLDLGCSSCREPGHIGIDIYPYDHGTLIHDLGLGLPFPERVAKGVRVVNALHDMENVQPKEILGEIARVLKDGGEMLYEGPEELTEYPKELVMTWFETNEGQVAKGAKLVYRQIFERVSEKEPLSEDAQLAFETLGEYWTDAVSKEESFEESKHPRDERGRFGSGGGESGGKHYSTPREAHADHLMTAQASLKDAHSEEKKARESYEKNPKDEQAHNNMKAAMKARQTLEQKVRYHQTKLEGDKPYSRSAGMAVSKAGDWDESKVSRDEKGRFGSGGGESKGKGELSPHMKVVDSAQKKMKETRREWHKAQTAERNAREEADKNPTDQRVHEIHQEAQAHEEKTGREFQKAKDEHKAAWDKWERETTDTEDNATKTTMQVEHLTGKDLGLDLSEDERDSPAVRVKIKDSEGKTVGIGNGIVLGDTLHIGETDLEDEFQGKGLGKEMYRSLYSAAAAQGAKRVSSGLPSAQAKHVHESLMREAGISGGKTSSGFRYNISHWSKPVKKADSKDLRQVPIIKADKHKQVVYGVVLAPDEVDSQEDWMSADDIESAAHIYLQKSRVVGSGHGRAIQAEPVESYIAPVDMELEGGQYGPQKIKKGSWVLGIKIKDAKEWQKVLEGEYQAFSVGGFGLRDGQNPA
jgi:GNAT superfamily N-acetyltransferase